MDEFGSISFAPTADQAQDALRRGQLEGIPQAIKVLSLRLPRVLGVKSPTAPDLLTAKGGQGIDPYLSAVLQTLAKTLAPMGPGPMMGGPDAGMGGSPVATPPFDPGPSRPPAPKNPNVDFIPLPGGTAGRDPFARERAPRKPLDESSYRRMI